MVSTPFLGKRRTVFVIVRTKTGERDAYGNDLLTESEAEVDDCLIAPTASNEDNTDADRLVDSATIYNMTGTWPDDSTLNRVRLPDNSMWEIDGAPQRWPGAIGGVVVQLRRVKG